jgi:pyridoxal phosphate enzyme (YggS family)
MRSFLADRLHAVEQRIQAACRRAGRLREAVTLVVVTKTVPVEAAALLPGLGILHLGESRPQELWRKAANLPSSVHWHLIGHLQRNKVERTLPLVELIHAVDSERLLLALEAEARRRERVVDILLEINASREPAKHGFKPEAVRSLMPRLAESRHVRLRGFMTMAAFEEDPERCRSTFAEVRNLRDRLRGELPLPHEVEQLSMGMSNDFEVAIEEGATLVRIGTALWEGLQGGGP